MASGWAWTVENGWRVARVRGWTLVFDYAQRRVHIATDKFVIAALSHRFECFDFPEAELPERAERELSGLFGALVVDGIARELQECAREVRAECRGSESARRRQGLVASGIELAARRVGAE